MANGFPLNGFSSQNGKLHFGVTSIGKPLPLSLFGEEDEEEIVEQDELQSTQVKEEDEDEFGEFESPDPPTVNGIVPEFAFPRDDGFSQVEKASAASEKNGLTDIDSGSRGLVGEKGSFDFMDSQRAKNLQDWTFAAPTSTLMLAMHGIHGFRKSSSVDSSSFSFQSTKTSSSQLTEQVSKADQNGNLPGPEDFDDAWGDFVEPEADETRPSSFPALPTPPAKETSKANGTHFQMIDLISLSESIPEASSEVMQEISTVDLLSTSPEVAEEEGGSETRKANGTHFQVFDLMSLSEAVPDTSISQAPEDAKEDLLSVEFSSTPAEAGHGAKREKDLLLWDDVEPMPTMEASSKSVSVFGQAEDLLGAWDYDEKGTEACSKDKARDQVEFETAKEMPMTLTSSHSVSGQGVWDDEALGNFLGSSAEAKEEKDVPSLSLFGSDGSLLDVDRPPAGESPSSYPRSVSLSGVGFTDLISSLYVQSDEKLARSRSDSIMITSPTLNERPMDAAVSDSELQRTEDFASYNVDETNLQKPTLMESLLDLSSPDEKQVDKQDGKPSDSLVDFFGLDEPPKEAAQSPSSHLDIYGASYLDILGPEENEAFVHSHAENEIARSLPQAKDESSSVLQVKDEVVNSALQSQAEDASAVSSSAREQFQKAWNSLASACANELNRAVEIWREAVDMECSKQLVATDKGKSYYRSVAEVYKVSLVLDASSKLYAMWFEAGSDLEISFKSSLIQCQEAWAFGLSDAVDPSAAASVEKLQAALVMLVESSIKPVDEPETSQEHCALSLLPFKSVPGIATVEWGGRRYLLPLANFWANRVRREPPFVR